MYSSNSNNPISSSYSDQPFFQRPFLNDITSSTSSKQADPSPLSFFPFPSPFEDDDVFLQQLLHPQSLTETEANMVESNKNHISGQTVQLAQQIPRKRCSKRDRHSKINTARGPRDRRMRLSLEVARKFFGLQDMLGYDKASKTVEWLLVQAKAEIKKLAREMKRTTCSASSTSDQSCEVVSGVDDQVAIYYNGNHHQQQPGRSVSQEKPSKEKKMIRQWRKCAFHPLARESREKARERARERTREKMRNRRGVDESKLCDLSPFETTGEESGTQSHSMKPSSWEVRPEINEQASSHVLNDDSLVIIGTWSPSVIFSSLNNTGISQEHQLADFQFFGKTWEA